MARPWGAALLAPLVLVACSHDGSQAASITTTAPGTPALAAGSSIPTVATTVIPGAPTSAPVVGGTSAPVPTTTIPLSPPSTGALAAPEPAPPDTTAPPAATSTAPSGSPATPPSSAASGDPGAFCRAMDDVLPLYLTTLILVDSGDSASSGSRFEVAVAPALVAPVHAAAANAPPLVAGPFQWWAARADAAVAALKGAGANDAQVNALAGAFTARVQQATGGDENQSPPDPVEAAAAAGIDAGRLGAATAAFTASNGDFDTFAGSLGPQLNLSTSQINELSAHYPCAADLGSFSG
jgi:hypothetical protein